MNLARLVCFIFWHRYQRYCDMACGWSYRCLRCKNEFAPMDVPDDVRRRFDLDPR